MYVWKNLLKNTQIYTNQNDIDKDLLYMFSFIIYLYICFKGSWIIFFICNY